MFNFLKKKIKDTVDKVSSAIFKEEHVHEQKAPEESIEDKIEKLKELEEKILEYQLPPQILEEKKEEEKIIEEVKEEESIVKLDAITSREPTVAAPLQKEPEKPVVRTESITAKMHTEPVISKVHTEPVISKVHTEPVISKVHTEPVISVPHIEPEKPAILIEVEKPVVRTEPITPTVHTEPAISTPDIELQKPVVRTEPAKPAVHKTSTLSKITKKITEKTLTESDIENILKSLQITLLESDVALNVAEKICNSVKEDLLNRSVKRGEISDVIKDALRSAMLGVFDQPRIDLEDIIEKKKPFTIMLFGFNGAGKTTCAGKLAHRLKRFKPILAAGDTFRTASIEQLEEHARNLDLKVVKHKYGADSAAVIFDAKKHAQAVGAGLVLADTAGRSHSNVNLMEELKKTVRINQPDLKVLVLDSTTGNDIYDQCRLFDGAIGVDAIILTKSDVYEKGGACISAAHTLRKPILFLGTGQEYTDFKEFNPQEIVDGLVS